MTYYACYNPNIPSPSPVIGWYDTDFNKTLPDHSTLLLLTKNQWDSRMGNPSGWAVSNGQLIPYTPPPPPAPEPKDLAQAAIYAGVTVNFTSDPSINAVYSCDPQAQSNITSTALYISINQKFPGNSTTMTWYDKAGNPQTFSDIATFNKFASAIADYVMILTHIIMTNSGTLPDPTITIS